MSAARWIPTLLLTAACVGGGELREPGDRPADMRPGLPDTGSIPDLPAGPVQDMAQDMGQDIPPEFGGTEYDMPPIRCDPGQTACGRTCVDLDSDPTSCGACGRTCVLPFASAACQAGQCAVAACEPGRFDVDLQVANGCETDFMCTGGADCMTTCGSSGVTACQGMTETCQNPPETCNGADDDCNGQCDEGAMAGCRVGIHRGRDTGHIYTNDLGAIPNVERENYFRLYTAEPGAAGGFQPVFLCRKPNGKHLLTSSTNCERAGSRVRELGFWATAAVCGALPLYRLYSEAAGNHFYTTNAGERDNAANNLGYQSEGIAGYVWDRP